MLVSVMCVNYIILKYYEELSISGLTKGFFG